MNDNLKIGERKIIELFYDNITKNPNSLYDDDVSSIKINDNLNVVFNSDMLIEKTDIPKDMNIFDNEFKDFLGEIFMTLMYESVKHGSYRLNDENRNDDTEQSTTE